MLANFTEENWQKNNENWNDFWSGKITRPMIFIERMDKTIADPPGFHSYFQQYDNDLSSKEILKIEMERFKRIQYMGDGIPRRFTNFGPGSVATYLGSECTCDDSTVWYHDVGKELKDIDIRLNRNSFWYKRVQDIQNTLFSEMGNEVNISFSDMGGNLDILASLRGSQNLLYDLYDNPEVVEQQGYQITKEWLVCYQEEVERLSGPRGFMPWAPIYSPSKTTYMLQCDFSYMISTNMFERYVMPDLTSCCEAIDIPFYHLDGKGELPHLSLILTIEKLKGVQWIPGAGNPSAEAWPEVLKQIRAAGKFVQIYLSVDAALELKSKMNLEGFVIELIGCDKLTIKETEEVYQKLIA